MCRYRSFDILSFVIVVISNLQLHFCRYNVLFFRMTYIIKRVPAGFFFEFRSVKIQHRRVYIFNELVNILKIIRTSTISSNYAINCP